MRHLLTLLLTCLFALTPAYADDDGGDDSTGRDDVQTYRVAEDVNMLSTIKFHYGKHRIIIKTIYPQLQSEDISNENLDLFNQQILDLVQAEVDKFRKLVADAQRKQQGLDKSQVHNDMYLDYDTSIIQSGKHHLLSIRFTIEDFISGLPHAYHYHKVFNYDLTDGEKIELKDLFDADGNYLAAFANYTSNALLKRFHNRNQVMSGTAPTEDNFSNWNVKPNGILITFDSYQVAPNIHGTQTVLVPYSILKRLISPDSAIYSCVMHQRSCARNNILTGGFIDTAINTHHRRFNPILSQR